MSKLGGKSIICAARGTAVAIVAGVSGAKLKGVLTWSAREHRGIRRSRHGGKMSEEKCQAIKNVFYFIFFFLLCFSFVPQPGSRSAFEPRRGLNVVKIFTLACLMKPVLLSVA